MSPVLSAIVLLLCGVFGWTVGYAMRSPDNHHDLTITTLGLIVLALWLARRTYRDELNRQRDSTRPRHTAKPDWL